MQAVGILGGTFNPVHCGHLLAARAIQQHYDPAKLLWLPNFLPPHKGSGALATPAQRLRMLELALAGVAGMEICTLELDNPEISYTWDTLVKLQQDYRDTPLFFVCGAEAVLDYEWYKLDEILQQLYKLVLLKRTEINAAEVVERLQAKGIKHTSKIEFFETFTLNISSTLIRERIAKGEPVTYLVPLEVERYIGSEGLYR